MCFLYIIYYIGPDQLSLGAESRIKTFWRLLASIIISCDLPKYLLKALKSKVDFKSFMGQKLWILDPKIKINKPSKSFQNFQNLRLMFEFNVNQGLFGRDYFK